jgi:hypothetical protein
MLAIDGRGIRGIIPAMILAEPQRRIGTDSAPKIARRSRGHYSKIFSGAGVFFRA